MYIKHEYFRHFFSKNHYPKFLVVGNGIKKDVEIFFFYLRKLSQLRGQFCSTALVKYTFYVKYSSVLMQCYKIDLFFEITSEVKKKYISRYFCIQFYASINLG